MKKILPLTMILYTAALPAADSFTETMRAITAARQARIGVSIIGIENDHSHRNQRGKIPDGERLQIPHRPGRSS